MVSDEEVDVDLDFVDGGKMDDCCDAHAPIRDPLARVLKYVWDSAVEMRSAGPSIRTCLSRGFHQKQREAYGFVDMSWAVFMGLLLVYVEGWRGEGGEERGLIHDVD